MPPNRAFKLRRFQSTRKIRMVAAVSGTALLGTAAAIFAQAATATYYVSPSGVDTNSGTSPDAPFKTIQKSLDVASAGAVINLAPGKYTELVTTKRPGTAENPITIQGPETGKDPLNRSKAVVYGLGFHGVDIDHSYYVLKGFTIDGQPNILPSEYPKTLGEARSFKDSVQSRAINSKALYIGASATSRDITGVVIDDMYVRASGGECVRFRNNAIGNVVKNSLIEWCGMKANGNDVDKYKYHNAEGIYIGTSPVSTTQPMYDSDTGHDNLITDTSIKTFGSECLNIKENAHNNKMVRSECMFNDEPLEFRGSNIEFRGHHNYVENTVISGSRSYAVKFRSDADKYDLGGNSIKLSSFSNYTGAAINLVQSATKVGEFCGNSFDNSAPLSDANSVGNPTKPCVIADTQAPTVNIVSPVNDATVSGTVTLKANATDNAGVTKVDFLLNGTIIGSALAAPYELPWTAPTANGSYTLSAKAYDAANNVGTASVTVKVGSDVILPSAPVNLTGTAASPTEIALSWSAAPDNIGAVSYDVYRNNVKVANTTGLSYNNASLTPNTPYSFYVKAIDGAGNQSPASATINVSTPPQTSVQGVSFEAESGVVTSPMVTANDASAQNGKYIVQPSGSGTGKVVYTFTAPTAGTYSFMGRVIAPSTSSDSFNYAFDSTSQRTWTLPSTARSTWTWAKAGTVSLSAGTHKLTIFKKENGTRLDAITLTLDAETATPSSINATSLFEAEAGTVSGGVSTQSDASASGGKYVIGKSSGTAIYSINVPAAGTYMIAGWVKAANGSSDSFNVKADSGAYLSWDLQDPTTRWTYDATSNPAFNLSAGNHTLTLQYREANASVDRLVLIKQ